MGRAIALRFAENGADLVLGARNLERVEAVAEEVRALGRKAEAVRLDITDRASCEAAVTSAVEAYGHLDILVNNAFHDGNYKSFEKSDLADWATTVNVNLIGTLQMTQAAVPTLKERADARIVMINTLSAHRTQGGRGAYSASKAALENATKTLALELGPAGIRVNGVHPSYIWGDSVEWYFAYLAEKRGITPDEVHREIADEMALRYIPDAYEIAGSVLFFASELSRPITGQSLGVNAGHFFR
jgi:NAD(P)-dependent dehydrogenase (short-subunit alcohol dehydrogenase family)